MQLIKIITHLISNGIKYNHPKGSVNIISTICSEGYIEIAIQDTGAGIQQHHWEDIFTAFTRLEYAEKKQIGGVGVGLSISRMLARKMHGDINLSHSSPDGSLFIISLPTSENPGLSAQLKVTQIVTSNRMRLIHKETTFITSPHRQYCLADTEQERKSGLCRNALISLLT